jgi:hypothetical protein
VSAKNTQLIPSSSRTKFLQSNIWAYVSRAQYCGKHSGFGFGSGADINWKGKVKKVKNYKMRNTAASNIKKTSFCPLFLMPEPDRNGNESFRFHNTAYTGRKFLYLVNDAVTIKRVPYIRYRVPYETGEF